MGKLERGVGCLSPRLILVTEPGPKFVTRLGRTIKLDPGLRRDDNLELSRFTCLH